MNTVQQKLIEVVPYNHAWPALFSEEAAKIEHALGGFCRAIHHVGSTAIPGLSAKPKIDIIAAILPDIDPVNMLEGAGFKYKGEWNIPFKYGFTKRGYAEVNLHVYEEGHPEIELNLVFRDYLRAYPEVKDSYEQLKKKLLQEETSSKKPEGALFSGYNLGKDAFICNVLKQACFNRIRFLKCTHYKEWEAVKHFRQHYFFDRVPIKDPYAWTFDHPDHQHMVLHEGVDILGYTHLQLWPHARAALRIMVIEDVKRKKGFGSQLLTLCEKCLKKKGYKTLYIKASPDVLAFYKKKGYVETLLNDPDGYECKAEDISVEKVL